ncbi:DMT family transporter [Paenibacillus planticolens]|uniref:EamA family transporter n=1 Tax=Paenibacillus planticolens TaxID=2654976 RepID=A0ABX2A1F3_9BACL|nr:EamA family transporter [Paenibacillus planticolens]NOV04815.1 EamA family transporter [Paenibacillus planticolens]
MLRSYLLLIFCVTVWGSNFVFGNILAKQFSPLFLAMARLLFISLFLLGYTRVRHRFVSVRKQEWKLLILLGIIGVFINQWSFYQGLQTADPTTSALILALTPITTALLAALFLKEALTVTMLAGSLVAITGVFLVVFNGARLEFHIGHLWIFVTMITFAISIVLVRLLARRLPPIITTLYSTLVGFGTMVPVVLAGGTGWSISHEAWAWVLLIVTAILMHGIVTLIWNSQLQKVGAAKAAMFSNLEPFVAMIVGYVILGQLVTSQQLFGSLFIVGGVTLASLTGKFPSKWLQRGPRREY